MPPRLTAFALIAAACAPPAPKDVPGNPIEADSAAPQNLDPVDLVVPTDWKALPQADDPYPSHRPDIVDCDPAGWHEEAGVLEVETNVCPYANLLQPTRAAIQTGDTLSLLTYHSALSAVDEPAEAHLAVLVDGDPIFDRIIPIPSASEIYDHEFTAQRDIPAGSPVVLHVHNHGGNAWKLAHLKRASD